MHSALRNTVLKILHPSSQTLCRSAERKGPLQGRDRGEKKGEKNPEELYRSPWYQQKYRRSHITELSTSELLSLSLPLCFPREFPILLEKGFQQKSEAELVQSPLLSLTTEQCQFYLQFILRDDSSAGASQSTAKSHSTLGKYQLLALGAATN